MLQNHNHPHMNYLPFLMSKKWEAVHISRALFYTVYGSTFGTRRVYW